MTQETCFFDVPDPFSEYESARMAILPIPYEQTTSYREGTQMGPAAIREGSVQVEFWEEMTRSEPYRSGIATLSEVELGDCSAEEAIQRIRRRAHTPLEDGKFLVSLGGEHTVTVGLLEAVRDLHGPVGVVQFDAHADLRHQYQGTQWSHACVMRRAFEAGHESLAVGIRALCVEEQRLIDDRGLSVIWGWELEQCKARFDSFLERLPDTVYLTFDLDYFDPTLVPATGTPVPGGGLWYPTLELLALLFRRKRVLAMDLVELAPQASFHSCDFLSADLIYKCLAFWRQNLD